MLIAQGVVIFCPCPACKLRGRFGLDTAITKGADAIREHLHQLATGGEDNPRNWQYWFKACSDYKTHGTKATSAGSDANIRAKLRRQRGENKPKLKRKIPSRPFAKRRKP